jgi:two-component system chemotaxis response regulator CheY
VARILIADDDTHIARVMSMWLNRHGHETFCAANGKDALDLAITRRVDLIITDMNMPQLDGLGFARAVREQLGSQIPMLVLSARCDQQALVQSLASYGVSVYPKPFLPSHLVAEINRLLAASLRTPGFAPGLPTEVRAP